MKRPLQSAIVAALVLAALPTSITAQITVEAEIAERIVDRMPQDAGVLFPADIGELFCWTRVTGAADTTIQHVWIHGDLEFPVAHEIGGSPWRTWSSKVIPEEWAGDWSVEIRDAEGNVLETLQFTVGG